MPVYVAVLQDHPEVVVPKIMEEFPAHICLTKSVWLIATEPTLGTEIICNRIGLVMRETQEEPLPESVAHVTKVLGGLSRTIHGEPNLPPNVNKAGPPVQPTGYVFHTDRRTGIGTTEFNAWLTGR